MPSPCQVNSSMQTIVSHLPGPPQYLLFASAADAEVEFQRDRTNVVAGIEFNYTGDPYAYLIRTRYGKTPATDAVFNRDGGN